MNKNEITQLVEMINVSSATAKSLTARLESALGKEGSASSRLSMAGSSLLALSDKAPEDDSDIVAFLGTFLKYASALAKEQKQQTPREKATREQWYDADSDEAQEILAKRAPKPRGKKAQKVSEVSADDIAKIVAQVLATR